jgi:vitamin B12/bleomycin/antimicrobial peptide transport system ATP-binding/permease protein
MTAINVRDTDRANDSAQFGAAGGFFAFAMGYWVGATARPAWRIAILVLCLLPLNLIVSLALNNWQRWFFDMLERRDSSLLLTAVFILFGLIFAGAILAVTMVQCRMTLQLNWRRWVTDQLIKLWIRGSHSGSRAVDGHEHGSAEYRIVEDVRLALEPIVELSIGLLNALIQGISFVSILIIVGGSFPVTFFGLHLNIPAYLAIAAVVYAAITSTVMFLAGQPLIHRIAEKNEAESQFLFQLARAAGENVPRKPGSIADEAFFAAATSFERTVVSWRRVIVEHCRLTWITNSNSFLAPVVPLLLTAPKYIDGTLSLGAVIQLAAAFTVVLGALNWVTDNYVRLAEWSASARRVDELRQALEHRA